MISILLLLVKTYEQVCSIHISNYLLEEKSFRGSFNINGTGGYGVHVQGANYFGWRDAHFALVGILLEVSDLN